MQYRLTGIVRHSGSKESGHYVAVTKKSNQWLEIIDEVVTTITLSDLHWCSKAYLLLYESVSVPHESMVSSDQGCWPPPSPEKHNGINGPKCLGEETPSDDWTQV